ncbi:MAG TPA: hypothetical protein PKA58_27860 [Polyangium sp.]|nr:hypothetical protein [Polyangium sp.]
MRFFDGQRMGFANSLQSTTQWMRLRVLMGLAGFACVAIPACGFNWDAYDPRLGSAVGGNGGAGTGGMSASSSSSSGSESGGAAGMGGMSGTGGMAGAGGNGGSGGGIVDVCGKVDLLTENFNNPIDSVWLWDTYAGPTTTLTQSMGQLVFTKSGTMVDGGYGALETTRMYDLRNSFITVEIVKTNDPMTDAQMSIGLVYDDLNDVGLHYQSGLIKFGATINGTFNEKGSHAHDASTRFWRLREANGAFAWDTSPDGQTWTPRGQAPTSSVIPEAVGHVRVTAFWPSNTIAQDEVRFDNLRGEPSAMPHWCSTSALQDDFNDNSTSHVWARSRTKGTCTYEEKNGQLVVHPSPTVSEYCGYRTGAAYDLTSSTAAVEIAQMVNTAANVDMTMSLDCQGGSLRITQNLGKLTSGYTSQGSPFELGSKTYDDVNHHWWRIRETGGMVYWEVSPDGKTWAEEAKTAKPFDVTACDLFLYVDTGNGVSMPGEARFDNVNLTP